MWTRSPDHPALDDLERRWGAEHVDRRSGRSDDWTRVAFDLVDGPDRAAELLQALTAAGVRISRFEKVDLPLAELIERVASDSEDGRGPSAEPVEVRSP
jgi:hypothetical protein